MTPIEMIDAGIRALRRAELREVSNESAAATARAWAALAEATMRDLDRAAAAMTDTQRDAEAWRAATHLDTVRPGPGPHHPTLFPDRRMCTVVGCNNMATHTIDGPEAPADVCTTHFTNWANARPI